MQKEFSKLKWLEMFQFIMLLLAPGLLSSYSEAKVFYVAPTVPADQACPPPCYTLDYYAQNLFSDLFVGCTSISLIFMEGVHNLSNNFGTNNYDLIEFRGLGASPEDTIVNLSPSKFIWLRANDVHLYNIGVYNDFSFNQFLSGTLQGLIFFSLNLDIQNCSISAEFLCDSSALSSTADIKNSTSVTFYNTNIRGLTRITSADKGTIRNSLFIGVLIVDNVQSLSILNCILISSQSVVKISGINLYANSEVFIQNITVSGAKTIIGLALTFVSNATITKSSIVNNTIGVQSINSNLNICDTEIIENNLGVVLISQHFQILGYKFESTIKNCEFSFNADGGLLLVKIQSVAVQITNCSFLSNNGTPITAYQSTFELQGETIFKDNNVRSGGGLTLINSTIKFGPKSNTMFINNTAEEFGGAVYIVDLPLIQVTQFTEFLILNQNNVNGDLMIPILRGLDLLSYGQIQRCFYLLESDSSVYFAGNSAALGGYDIFGATKYTEECSLLNNPSFRFSNETSNTYKISSDPTRVCFCINNVSQCENRRYLVLNETRYPGETFAISVVLAGYNYGRVAGSVYTNVLGEDYKQGISESQHVQTTDLDACSDLTYTVSSSETSTSVVLVLTTQEQNTQQALENEAEAVSRNIHSHRCLNNMTFPCTALLTTPVYVHISLEACPLGFELNKTTRVCDCDTRLAYFRDNDQAVITCEIQNRAGYIRREGTVWIGMDTSKNNTNVYYWHRHCPRDHCNSSQTPIDLRSPNRQCSSNRAGVLCGRCQANYSLQLGGNRCLKCKNSYLVLLIVFAVLGILLVILIKLLNLTVANGTINGLIFYANVVWRNNTILFSFQDGPRIGYYIITMPIAWINLDFGIETCLSENLDQLTKTGLQFVFPVYIWCIAGLIIIISHYSTRATKLFGNNSISVLATLFLLSYGKLFRNITDVFTFADIPNSNGTTHKVWSLDGNIRYGGTAGHIVLLVVALLFLVLFLLPFTLTLLLVPFLRAKSHLRPLHWINTLHPFFDTYYGPFKNKKQHHVWTGILLVSRVVILIVFASTSTSSPNANILLMTLVSVLLLMYSASVGLLYKKWYSSILENLYILNLIMLGGTFLFYHPTSANEENIQHNRLNPVATTSVIIALLLFFLTVIIYTAKRVFFTERVQSYLMRNHNSEDDNDAAVHAVPEARANGMGPTVQIVSIKKDEYDPTQFRETLLETLL